MLYGDPHCPHIFHRRTQVECLQHEKERLERELENYKTSARKEEEEKKKKRREEEKGKEEEEKGKEEEEEEEEGDEKWERERREFTATIQLLEARLSTASQNREELVQTMCAQVAEKEKENQNLVEKVRLAEAALRESLAEREVVCPDETNGENQSNARNVQREGGWAMERGEMACRVKELESALISLRAEHEHATQCHERVQRKLEEKEKALRQSQLELEAAYQTSSPQLEEREEEIKRGSENRAGDEHKMVPARELGALRRKLEDEVSRNSSLQKQLQDLAELKTQEVTRERGEAEARLDEVRRRCKELEEQLSSSEANITQLKSALAWMDAEIESVNQQRLKLKEEKEKLEGAAEKKATEVMGLQQQNMQWRSDADECKREKQKLMERVRELQSEREMLKAEVERLFVEKGEVLEKMEQLNNQYQSLASEKDRLSSLSDTLSSNLASERQQLHSFGEQLRSEKEKLRAQLEQFKLQNEQLNSNSVQFQSQIEQLKSCEGQLQFEIEQLSSKNEQLSSQNEQLQSENGQLLSENEELRSQNQNRETQVEQLSAQFETERREYQKSRDSELEGHRSQVHQLEFEIAQSQNSLTALCREKDELKRQAEEMKMKLKELGTKVGESASGEAAEEMIASLKVSLKERDEELERSESRQQQAQMAVNSLRAQLEQARQRNALLLKGRGRREGEEEGEEGGWAGLASSGSGESVRVESVGIEGEVEERGAGESEGKQEAAQEEAKVGEEEGGARSTAVSRERLNLDQLKRLRMELVVERKNRSVVAVELQHVGQERDRYMQQLMELQREVKSLSHATDSTAQASAVPTAPSKASPTVPGQRRIYISISKYEAIFCVYQSK